MKCLICNNYFYLKKSLLDLFKTKKEYICDKCYKKYPIHLRYELIELDMYQASIISLFDKKYNINLNVFHKEYSKIFENYFNKEEYQVIFLDYLSLDDRDLEALDGISKLFEKNLIVIVYAIINNQ